MTREEAIKRLREYSQYAYGVYHNEQKDEEALDMAIEALQAEPVKHGKWKWRRGGECSECGFHNSNFDFNFCPNCGAKMDKGRDTE